ncbi:hypothetical protein [Leifsonia sp. AG29]|uniref:hypothetical protein n=1 Tax=Leifsonia sp. AG29 TaxID=2598860 RepID=UPI00131D1010|nr:hypothetical protein [Leifsonia sp. AG29]
MAELDYNHLSQFGNPTKVADISGRVVTHQQLSNPDFYALVKGELIAGRVDVIDQGCDRVQLPNGDRVGFDDPQAAVELAKSQMRWVSQTPSPSEIFDTLGLDWFDMQIDSLKFEQQDRTLNSLGKTD